MGCFFGGLKTTALVNGNIHQNGAFLHRFEHVPGHQGRGLTARNEHGSHHQVRLGQDITDGGRTGHQGHTLTGHHIAQIAQPIQVDIKDVDLGSQSAGHFGGIDAHRTASDNDNGGRINTGNTPQQNPVAALGHLQKFGALLNRHGTGHLTHGSQQRQGSVSLLNGFISDTNSLSLDQGMGQFFRCRQMEIRKIDLALSNQRQFKRLGFLNTHNHFGPFKNIFGRINDFGTGFLIGCVAECAGLAGIFLDKDLMSMLPHEFNSPRAHTHAIFFSLDFF